MRTVTTKTYWARIYIACRAGYASEHASAPDGMIPFAGFGIVGPDGKSIASMPSTQSRTVIERQANAELIVEACNSHAANVARIAELETALRWIAAHPRQFGDVEVKARAALAKATS